MKKKVIIGIIILVIVYIIYRKWKNKQEAEQEVKDETFTSPTNAQFEPKINVQYANFDEDVKQEVVVQKQMAVSPASGFTHLED